MEPEQKMGCVIVALWAVFSLAWLAFLIWVIVTVVEWLVTK